jgi:alkylhydroperoxidase family enzyme
VDINSLRVRDTEGGLEKLAQVAEWRESSAFSPEERAALELADRMTISGQAVDDDLFARLRDHFSEAQIVELAAAVALENFRSKFNPAFGIEAQGMCLLPDKR